MMGYKSIVTLCFGLVLFRIGGGQHHKSTSAPRFCGGHPADIVFVMDSSGSIGAVDFERQKEFVSGMVDLFDIDTGKIRMGVVSYSNWAILEFNLNTFKTKKEIRNAVDEVRHFRGDTNTGATISYMRDVMFQPHNGARQGVPHIAIILTDGRSNDPLVTMTEARKAREMGITMFAIGVGNDLASYELSNIASDPDSEFVFQVGNYIALQYIKELLAIKTCEVQPQHASRKPPYYFTTTVAPQPLIKLACKDTALADIVFATSPGSSTDNADKTLAFFKEIVAGLDIVDDRIRIGMVPRHCDTLPDIHINGKIKQEVLDTLDTAIKEQRSIDDVIKYMRKSSFSKDSGSRGTSKKIGVLIVEEGDSLYKSKLEAHKAKEEGDIELFVIGVGPKLKTHRLVKIASEPSSEHFFHVKTYDDLPPILKEVENAICPPPSTTS